MSQNILILGRPNVGKSSLFNRLAGFQKAITYELPGTTRDFHEWEIEWNGKVFGITDTGGMPVQMSNPMEKELHDQLWQLVSTAGLVLMVVDGSTDLSYDDISIAKKLQKYSVPKLLAVNKMDRRGSQSNSKEHYKLGLGEPIPIAAIHGTGVGDLLDKMAEHFKKTARKKKTEYTLGIYGRPNVGKSTFYNALLGEDRVLTSPIPGTTRDTIETRVTIDKQSFLLMDTAGLRQLSKLKDKVEKIATGRTKKSINKADGAIFLMDAEQAMERQDLRIFHELQSAGCCIATGINKWDLINNREENWKKLRTKFSEKMNLGTFFPMYPLAAIENDGIHSIIKKVLDMLAQRDELEKNPRVSNYFKNMFEAYPCPQQKGKPVHLGGALVRGPRVLIHKDGKGLIPANYTQFLLKRFYKDFNIRGISLKLVFAKNLETADG